MTRGLQTLLGGRVCHAQPTTGHRTGIEPVLLAAAIQARAGERVVEGGTGSGAGLLCLAVRVPGITGVGVERDAGMAAVARANIAANGFAGLSVCEADLAAWQPGGPFDHAFANPPWHDEGTASPDAAKEDAKRAGPGLFALWTARLAGALRHHGTLTLIVSAACLPECLAALPGAACGSPTILPLWPKAGRAAKLVLLRAVRHGRGPCRLLPGLVLHQEEGGFTAEAEAVLRDGARLDL